MPTMKAPRSDFNVPKAMAVDLHKELEEESREKYPEGLEVTNVRPSRVSIGGLVFLPGETKIIPPEHVARVRKHQWFGKVIVEGRANMPTPAPMSKPSDLASYDEDKAIAFIRLETDRQLLGQWARNETRVSVVEALADRAKAL